MVSRVDLGGCPHPQGFLHPQFLAGLFASHSQVGPHKQAGGGGGGGAVAGGVFCATQWHTFMQPQLFAGPVASQLHLGPHPQVEPAIGGATDVSIGSIETAGFVCG